METKQMELFSGVSLFVDMKSNKHEIRLNSAVQICWKGILVVLRILFNKEEMLLPPGPKPYNIYYK